jgi:hypothetical protein
MNPVVHFGPPAGADGRITSPATALGWETQMFAVG